MRTKLRRLVPLALSLAAAGLTTLPLGGQQATFRASVDLIAVDVQVVTSNGFPIGGLDASQFDVQINGKRRRVVSADFIQSAPTETASQQVVSGRAIPAFVPPADEEDGRVFMIAVDVSSFSVGASRGVMTAARQFIASLQPNDLVGLATFPIGPSLAPTKDHFAVSRRLDTIVGLQRSLQSEFNLTPSEVVDITAELAGTPPIVTPARGVAAGTVQLGRESDTVRRVQMRECKTPTDSSCAESIQVEATSLAFFLEGQVTEALSRLRAVLQGLGAYPGRKMVVLLSAGMTASDRPGGRPDVAELGRAVGEEAARANASIYALHIDSGSVESFSADKRRPSKSPADQERESTLVGRLLDTMATASGGTMFRVLVGSGEQAFARVLHETSSHYLLGVLPDAADRDGRLRELKVRVNQKDAIIRSRVWVLVPKKRSS